MIIRGHTSRAVLYLRMEHLFDMRLSVRLRDVLRNVYSRTSELVTQFLHGLRANCVQYFNCRIHGIIIIGGTGHVNYYKANIMVPSLACS